MHAYLDKVIVQPSYVSLVHIKIFGRHKFVLYASLSLSLSMNIAAENWLAKQEGVHY